MKVGALYIPERYQQILSHFRLTGLTAAGISGGRTSALMHVLTLAANQDQLHLYLPLFANTGREHNRTLDFLHQIELLTGFFLRWVQFTPPTRLGEALAKASFCVVTYETASRDGEPFEAGMAAISAYRKEVGGDGQVLLGVMERLCTSYLKIRTMHKAARAHWGPVPYTHLVGLRADEPSRVASLRGVGSAVVAHTPLAAAGLTKEDVLAFWEQQPINLDIPEYLGNCRICFLKDEADQAAAMRDLPEEATWWIAMQARYGSWRRGKASTQTILRESRFRLEVIRPAVASGLRPPCPPDFTACPEWVELNLSGLHAAATKAGREVRPRVLARTPREWAEYRWSLLVRQEERRLKEGPTPFSCACESVQADGLLDGGAGSA